MKTLKKYRGIIVLIFGILIVLLPYLWFIRTPYFEEFKVWSSQNILLLCISLVVVKVIGIIFPPIPGGLFVVGSIPIIGWFNAYLLDLLGTVIGSSIAYFLGKKYGYQILRLLFDDAMIARIHKIRVRKDREVETIFVLRFISGSLLAEIVCYAAGVLKISFKHFIVGTILAHVTIVLLTYSLANNLFQLKLSWISGIILLVSLPILWKFRSRYLE